MPIASKDRTILRAPAPRFTKTGYWELLGDVADLNDNVQGFWRFNKRTSETDAQAAARCSRNLKKGAANLALDRQLPGGPQTYFTDYARFRNDRPLVTRELIKSVANGGTGQGAIFALCKCGDEDIGDSSSHRAFIAGTFGNTLNHGIAILYNNFITPAPGGQFQALTYAVTSSALTTSSVNVTTGTLDLWRLLYLEWDASVFAVKNLTGDSSEPADVTLTGGHLYGTQTFTIGGRVTSGANYADDDEKDIAAVLLMDTKPSSGDRTIIAAQMLDVFNETSLTYFDS